MHRRRAISSSAYEINWPETCLLKEIQRNRLIKFLSTIDNNRKTNTYYLTRVPYGTRHFKPSGYRSQG